MTTEALMGTEVPAQTDVGLFKKKPYRKKRTIQKNWASKEEAAQILGISVEEVIKMTAKTLIPGTHLGRLYISRESIEENNKNAGDPGRLNYQIVGSVIYRISKSESRGGWRKIRINLTEYLPGRFGYELKDLEDAFRESSWVIKSIVEKNNLEVTQVGNSRYIDRQAFKDLLRNSQKERQQKQ
jgi:hypothetical protein